VDKSAGGGGCSSKSLAIGFAAVIVAVVLYGSNFIPVKRFDTGDGMFFQWMLCIGIWLCGLVINFARQQPPFFYPAVFGAICWTTGVCVCGVCTHACVVCVCVSVSHAYMHKLHLPVYR